LEFLQQQLDNGLNVIAECNGRAYSTAVGFFVSTGARDETADVAGVSHFLEHMTFKGTPTRTAEDVNRELDEIGSFANACTDEEQTIYHATVLPEYQDCAVEVLADIMRPSLREEDFHTEKKVIIEEIRKHDDQPPFGAHEKCMAAHFGAHPLGHSVLGTVQSITDLTPHAMRAYFDRRYSPGNITLVATGRVDFDSLTKLAEKHCGHWQPFAAKRDTPPAPANTGFHVVTKESAAQEYVVQIAAGPAAADDDRFAGRVLAMILGDDSGSRYYWELVDPGLAECAAVWSYEHQGAGLFMTFMCCTPGRTADNLGRIQKAQRAIQQDGIAGKELAQAKSKIRSHVVRHGERPANRLFAVGNGWLRRREYRSVREVIDDYQAVTRDDVVAVLAKYPPSIHTTVAVGPLEQLAPPT